MEWLTKSSVKGQVFACCVRSDVMGVAKTKAELESVLVNENYQRLRKSLETGVDLDPACVSCMIRPAKRLDMPAPEAAPTPVEPSTPWNKIKRLWPKVA